MGKKPFLKYLTIYFFITGLSGFTNGNEIEAQDFSVSATPDSTLMVIGGQMDITIEVAQPRDLKVVFPQFTDTITKNIEIVETTGPDTSSIGEDRIAIKQVFRVTSFDSGLHYIPPMEFELAAAEMETRKRTRSFGISVVNPFEEVDPKKGIADIKAPIDTPFKISELYRFLPWIIGGLAMALLFAAAIWFYVKRRNPLKTLIPRKPKEPPHVVALRKLDHIKEEKLWQKGQVKQFHSDISEILRHYIEDRYGIPAPEQITSEIIESLQYIDMPDDSVAAKIKQVLEQADLVKFAKYEPLPDENNLSLVNAYFFVNQTKHEEPPSTDTGDIANETNNENKKQAEQKTAENK